MVQQWQDAHDDKERQIEQLKAEIAEISSETAVHRREVAAVENWRADGGKIELDDDSRDEEHARMMTTLQNDIVDLEEKLRSVRAERDKARDQRDGLQLELTDLRAANKKWQIKTERDAAASVKAKDEEIVKLKDLAHQQAEDCERLRTELREITMLMEEKEGIEDLERQLGDQVIP